MIAFVSHFLPPILAYLVVAVLAVTPQTHALRVALWPVVTVLALRAVASLDISVGDPGQKWINMLLVLSMVVLVTHTLYWVLAKEPLVRDQRPAPQGSQSTIMDALDLALTLRGYGWEWSRGVHLQCETRPTNRTGFTFHVILSAVTHTLVFGILQKAIRSFSPMDIGAAGGSIFDESLPFRTRYLRSSVISVLILLWLRSLLQILYDGCTIVGVVVFRQEPQQWPPVFNAPLLADSLSDFWGRRWHSFFRHTLLVQGGYPLRFLFGGVGFLGRVGYVSGTFLSSRLMHYVVMVVLNNQFEFWRMPVAFGMMALVILAEDAFKMLTGRKVGGVAGRIWMVFWLSVGGNAIADGFARGGMFGCLNFVERVVPRRDVVERLVVRFDSWLHATL